MRKIIMTITVADWRDVAAPTEWRDRMMADVANAARAAADKEAERLGFVLTIHEDRRFN